MKIDFHSHVIPCEFLDAVAADPAGFSGVRVEIKDGERFLARDVIAIKLRTAYYDLAAKLAAMDRMGIDVAVISCGPPAYCDRKSTRLNSSYTDISRMPSSA